MHVLSPFWTIRSSKTKCLSDSSLDLEKYLTRSGCAVLMNASIKQQTTKLLSSWYIYNTIFILNNNNNKIRIYTKANWYLIWALSPVAIKLFIIQILDLQFLYKKLESITLLKLYNTYLHGVNTGLSSYTSQWTRYKSLNNSCFSTIKTKPFLILYK